VAAHFGRSSWLQRRGFEIVVQRSAQARFTNFVSPTSFSFLALLLRVFLLSFPPSFLPSFLTKQYPQSTINNHNSKPKEWQLPQLDSKTSVVEQESEKVQGWVGEVRWMAAI
jgi:hypothetical protein